MPRVARKYSIAPHTLYHITCRGNNQQNIFLSNRDKSRFLKRLSYYRQKFKFKIYCYILMENHYHLLIESGPQYTVSQFMQGLNTSYALYFTKKYQISGHLFQGRYHARIVDKDNYLLEVIRYIHLNPIRAKIVENLNDFQWSSYHEYLSNFKSKIVEKDEILSLFGTNKESRLANFKKFLESSKGSGTDYDKFYKV